MYSVIPIMILATLIFVFLSWLIVKAEAAEAKLPITATIVNCTMPNACTSNSKCCNLEK